MRILYSITKGEIGGAQVHVAQLAKFMKDSGHAVAILAAPDGWLENEATKLGVRFYPNPYFSNSFNPFRILKSFSFVKKIVSEFSPDVIHAHSSFAGIVTRLTVRNRVPTIFTAHSFAFTDGASLFRKIIASVSERFAARFTAKIICVSEYDRQLALRYKIAPAEKLITIYNGVEGVKEPSSEKERTFLCVGRLAYPKEYLLLIKAFTSTGLSDSKLVIVGEGPDREKIESKIKRLKFEERVIIMGELSQTEVREEMRKAACFVLISKHEGLPMTILEAMSAGLPIIASNVGGIPEEIDKSCGILVRNTKEDITSALQKLSNPFVQKEMGEASRKKFEDNFTLEKFLTETEKVYKSVFRSL